MEVLQLFPVSTRLKDSVVYWAALLNDSSLHVRSAIRSPMDVGMPRIMAGESLD